MSNKELLDAYFNGEMNEAESLDFLNQVEDNNVLKQEFNFQKEIVEVIQSVRKAELKARLNNVVVGGSAAEGFSVGKFATLGGIIVIAGLSYLYFSNDTDMSVETVEPKAISESYEEYIPTEDIEDETEKVEELAVDPAMEEAIFEKEISEINDDQDEVSQPIVTAPNIHKPEAVEPLEITNEDENEVIPGSGISSNSIPTSSSIDIEIDDSRKKYSFHYQMKGGRLYLFGTFDKGLYEILEFNSVEGKILFLYYKEKYYGINKNQNDITALQEVTESSLLAKLKEARK